MTTGFLFSIRTILLTGFCGLSAVGISLALAFGLSTAVKNTSELLTENIEALVDRMATDVEARVLAIERRARFVAARVGDDSIALTDPMSASTDLFFHTVLETTPGALGAAFVSKDGQFVGWATGKDGSLRQDLSQDADTMAWLRAGETNPESGWGPPIWVDSLDAAAIVFDMPLSGPDGYIGYLRFALSVSDFSFSLTRIDKHAFVLFGKDEVMAHPLMIQWRPLNEANVPSPNSIYDGRSALIPLRDLGDPILEQIWNTEELDFGIGRGTKGDGFVAGIADVGDGEFVFVYRTLQDVGAKPLTVGTYIDAHASDAVFDRMGAAAIGGGVVIVIAVVLGLFVARAIGRPIAALADASSIVEEGKLDAVPALPRSHVYELNRAVSSFEGMVSGLAEKEMIRQTLGRYVPASIAEQLMKDDGSLQPIEADATILFSDIAGFTKLTEELGPTRIVEVLNAYFSRMTQIIEAEGGVITQFQGDAILAIFNVPISASDHAERACRAAVEMRNCARDETFAGQSIGSRIGVNTGPVVAGAVGAEGRLTYTVHGDAVNRAARIEALNKKTGTTLLVSEATARHVRTVALRAVGEIDVRGQSEPVTVFTTDE